MGMWGRLEVGGFGSTGERERFSCDSRSSRKTWESGQLAKSAGLKTTCSSSRQVRHPTKDIKYARCYPWLAAATKFSQELSLILIVRARDTPGLEAPVKRIITKALLLTMELIKGDTKSLAKKE